MSGLFGNTTKRLLTYMLLIAMTVMLINKVVYTHIHFLPDSSMVTHAHPFSKGNDSNPKGTHQHSKLELIFYQDLDLLFFSTCAVFFLRRILQSMVLPEPVRDQARAAYVPLHQERPPPVCM